MFFQIIESMRLNEKMKMAELKSRLKWSGREASTAKQKAESEMAAESYG